VDFADSITRRVGNLRVRHRLLRADIHRLRVRGDHETEEIELERYRFWHLDYGTTAYYDQMVFKRHKPIPPVRATAPDRLTGK
jgi:hypothetical protein